MDWHPPDWLMNSAVIVAALSVLALVIRMIGPWRKQISDTEARLRNELIVDRARCEAELRLVRRRERGSRQLIYSLLHLVGTAPGERREGALASIRATLAEMERVEAVEAGMLIATLDSHLVDAGAATAKETAA